MNRTNSETLIETFTKVIGWSCQPLLDKLLLYIPVMNWTNSRIVIETFTKVIGWRCQPLLDKLLF